MIDWTAFVTVFVVALVSALLFTVLFALALRLGDGEAPWRRVVSVVLFALAGIEVLVGLLIIVPFDHFFG
jgi:hypothetical protein